MYVRDIDPLLTRPAAPKEARAVTNLLRAFSLVLLFALLGALYFFEIRPAQLTWGATAEESARAMPDDGLVVDPVFNATRAITINATPRQIWPWLIQMGFGRAGFYGYDLIENLGSGRGIRSANSIMPVFQTPKTGDQLPLSVVATLVYGPIQPDHFLVWRSTDVPCDGTFVWELIPIDATHTRLISRIHWNYAKTPAGFLLGVPTEFTDHVAVRKILAGIRDRAEGLPPQSLLAQGFEVAAYILAGFNLLLAVCFVGFWRSWIRAWFLALVAGLLLEVIMYGAIPDGVRDVLPWLYLAALVVAASSFGRSRFNTRPAFA